MQVNSEFYRILGMVKCLKEKLRCGKCLDVKCAVFVHSGEGRSDLEEMLEQGQ